MGNCIKKEYYPQSGDEDWLSVGSDQDTAVVEDTDYYYKNERKSLIEKNKGGFMTSSSSDRSSSANDHHEVRIKMTKKQLEHLLKKADAEGLPLQQVLVQLMTINGGDDDLFEKNQRSWRPALQSIPE